ncbi:MAG: dihydrodipicolinate synthase family protein [Pseudomonadota bacterium]|nr:dihydrodipicolinate synthase family protein [Pseudomonadota bacterium]
MPVIKLPTHDRRLESFELSDPWPWPQRTGTAFNRIAYAAVHVAAEPLSHSDPSRNSVVDWDATIAFREHIWDLGLGVAEAMDTAQRGMGMDWPSSRELIERTLNAARGYDGEAIVGCGTGTDQLIPDDTTKIEDVIHAYEEQCDAVQAAGGRIILMASRALAACARSPEDYAHVYDRILGQIREPVIIHWLGDMFDPALKGYWGYSDLDSAMDICLEILKENATHIDGIKISLLDAQLEINMRRRLPSGVRMYTGDDFNFAELIAGDAHGHSDALLGIFDAIAPAASAALKALADDDPDDYNKILAPTVPLARHIFKAPTQHYKTGVALMAYLNGLQDHFTLIGGQQRARSLLHLCDLFRLADRANLLRDPDLAVSRMEQILAVHGIDKEV